MCTVQIKDAEHEEKDMYMMNVTKKKRIMKEIEGEPHNKHE